MNIPYHIIELSDYEAERLVCKARRRRWIGRTIRMMAVLAVAYVVGIV